MDVSRKYTLRTFPTATLVLVLLFNTNVCNACQPTDSEIIEAKFYRSEFVVQATVSRQGEDDAVRLRVDRTLKGIVDENEITITGFGTEDPCFWESTDLSENVEYILFLGERRENGFYPIVGNPEESTDKQRKTIRKFNREGAAPSFATELKDKMYTVGQRPTLSCKASGYPSPKLTMTKDGVKLTRGAVKGISYKSGKGGIRLKFKKLQKSLHEGVYACIADNGVHPAIMTSANIAICALGCDHGVLNVTHCKCHCETEWDGLSCNIPLVTFSTPTDPPCSLDCGDHGLVADDECRCVCDDNYLGDTCDQICDQPCDIQHGKLDPTTCTCHCNAGYYGDTCSSEFALSSGDGGGITAGTVNEICNAGTYCSNGGTCYLVDDPKKRELVPLCGCPEDFIGERCEIPECTKDCGEHGTIEYSECRCTCDQGYEGTYCERIMDDHTEPCGPQYKHYCMNGGGCVFLKGIEKPSCRCPILYHGKRCERLEPDVDCGCLNGGECYFNESKQIYVCNCLAKYTGERCQYKALPPSRPNANTQENSRKMIITMCVIFVSMLIVIGIVIIVYVRNRNAREKERREKLEQMIRDQRTGMRLRSSLQPGAGGSYPADDIEMTNFRNSANQQSAINMESEHPLGARKSSNQSLGRGSLSRSNNGSMNGMPRQSPQTSIHSNHSQNEKSRGGKEGYAAVPTEEQMGDKEEQPKNNSDTSLEGRGDPDTLPLNYQGASSDLGSESEESDGEGDIIDVPNPQIQAIHNHLGGSDHDSGDYTWDEHSSPGLRITSPYTQDMSPLHQPRGRGRLNGVGSGRSPDHVNIHENPLVSPGYKTDEMNNVTPSIKDDHYADRLKDVVENSPPSAV